MKYIYIVLILAIVACKKNKKKEVSKPLILVESVDSITYSKVNFFDLKDCCIEKKIDFKKRLLKYTYNSNKCDLIIYFYPKKTEYFSENNINKDLENLNNSLHLFDNYDIVALYFPGEKLEPIYEGYDEPSYYDYSFPAVVKIYKYQRNGKWALINEKEVGEDAFFSLKDSDLRDL
ncbi:hypothetical protein JAO71_08890 [Olleya sp. YSTF-M6]|uniref:Lipoprotein n=1 Tax=Olleya sediminilitoris TaxID=2795739 RepID=A0ABS1WLB0_9FLAO|nr:hypothetical protein [Olleya sediminilitoris]MBL7559916.1 hypothetical protein [Olleya sediminilitoris]